MDRKTQSLVLLFVATCSGMSPWFMAAAIMPDMAIEAGIADTRLAWLSSVVPAGFGIGALALVLLGQPDRVDPRHLFASCAFAMAVLNVLLLVMPIGGATAIALRLASGVLMAGTWPVSMKIAVGWTVRRRGTLMGSLVAALVAGQAMPYLLAWSGGANWRLAIVLGSAVTASGGLAILLSALGPRHARPASFRTRAIALIWTDRRIRAAVLGYLGHMWEFIALWARLGVFAAVSYAASLGPGAAASLGKLTAFSCILAAAPACVIGGLVADRMGKGRVAAAALAISGTACVLTALTFGGPVRLTFALLIVWGAAVVPDSPQFSALVADFAPPELAGSLLTLQASLGFLMTALTTQMAPLIAQSHGWPVLIGLLALGPAFGLYFVRPVLGERGGSLDRDAAQALALEITVDLQPWPKASAAGQRRPAEAALFIRSLALPGGCRPAGWSAAGSRPTRRPKRPGLPPSGTGHAASHRSTRARARSTRVRRSAGFEPRVRSTGFIASFGPVASTRAWHPFA